MAKPKPEGVLGANFNGDPKVASFAELNDVQATWVRGFFAMPDADQGDPATKPAIQWLLDAAARGYGTVLSLKFPYSKDPIPAPGQPTMDTALKRLDKVLDAVLGKIDIIGIGNEPFFESRKEDRDSRLNVFYENLARHAISRRDGAQSNTQLFMGALNRLDQPTGQTPATERWVRFVHDTPGLAGTDIHPHVSDPDGAQKYLDYVLPKLRADQRFLATEFSLVQLYAKHLTDKISADYADRYQVNPDAPVWQVIRNAIRHPFPQQKWDDFLAMSPFFADNKNFLTDQVGKFRDTGKLAVATYGIGQDTAMSSPDFGADSPPWLLNSMFCQHTVQPASNGLPGRNTNWTDQFRALQS